MNELLLIVTIAGSRVAFPAAKVESVVELDALSPVPRAAPHIAGLSALRSRVLTVIDCQRSLELGSTDWSGLRETTSRDLQIGRFLFGVTYRVSDRASLNWSVEVGATEDATDLRTVLRIPFVLLTGG